MKRETVTTLVILCVIVLVVAAIAYFFQKRNAEQKEVVDNAALSIFDTEETGAGFTTLGGGELPVSMITNKIIIAQSWASWCPPCVGQLQLLAEVQKQYPNVQVMAVNRSENARTAQRFIDKQSNLEGLTLVLDSTDRFFTEVDAYNMPETIIFNEQGEIVFQEHGPTTKPQINAVLRSIKK